MKQSYSISIRGVLICTLMWLATTMAFAQKSVSGKVSDASGMGIPGVSITLKGAKTGTATDADGNYKIAVPNSGGTLIFTSIGYKRTEVSIGNQTAINVTLEDDAAALNEVVVTGYQTENKHDNSAAVSTVKAKDLQAVPTGNVEQQLQGRVAGVTVITNGQPGTDSQIRVRGFGAFGGNEPLYVIDGVPTGSVNFVSPNDIEETTVLKDAAAASIYGARAANGVVVITTKKGKTAQKLKVDYDLVYGVTTPGASAGIMNPQDQATWTWNAVRNATTNNNIINGTNNTPVFSHPQYGTGATPVLPTYLLDVDGNTGITGTVDMAHQKALYNIDPTAGAYHQLIKANLSGTDWYKAITRNAPLLRQSLGFSGGSDRGRYYIGLSAQNQDGIIINNTFSRYAIRTNSEFDVTKHFRIGENLQMTYITQKGALSGGGRAVAADENDLNQAYRMPSIIPIYDEFGGYAGTAAKGFNNPRNPVATRNTSANNLNSNTFAFGNVYAEYDVIPGLKVRSTLGGQYYSNYYNFYSPQTYEHSENNSSYTYGEGAGYNLSWVWTNTAEYKKKFGVHAIDVIAGQEALNTGTGRSMSGQGLNPFSTDPNYVNLNTVASSGKVVGSTLVNGVNFYSLFAKAGYIYNDKYIVNATVRRDGSSRFGSNSRYGVFPAFSAAWRVSSESFMKELPFISDLKLRAGWGQMGNSNNVDPNNQFSLYSSIIAYDITGANSSAAQGFYRSRIGNPNAKWETSETTNIGLDASFLNGKWEIAIDWWKKNTKDLLYQVPLPLVVGGTAAAPSINVGNMLNRGLDIFVKNSGKIKNTVGYEVSMTGSFLHNEITYMAPGINYFDAGTIRSVNPVRNQVGQSISAFYGYQVVGLFQSASEVKSSATQNGAAPGRLKFADLNGDGVIDDKDRTFLGSPVPKFTGGMFLKFSYKSFSMESYFNTSIGNKIYNFSKWYTDFYPSFSGAAISTRVKNSWTTTNTGTSVPIFEDYSGFSSQQNSTSYYVEDGSYLRMQSLSFGYELPKSIIEKIRMQKLKAYVQTTNLFTITKYSGLDPAVGGSADTNFGIDIGNYPVTRGFNVGLSATF